MDTVAQDNLPEFVEREPYEQGFTKFYNDSIKPQLGGLESSRMLLRAKHNKRLMICIPLAVLLFCAGIYLESLSSGGDAILFKMCIFIGFLLFGWAYSPVFKYKSQVKNQILPIICSFFGNLTYFEHGTQPKTEVEKAGIFPKYSGMQSEDLIRGTYEGVALEMQELKLTRGSGKNKKNVFKGVIFIAEFNKKFAGRTYIKKDMGKFSNWLESLTNDLEKVELEDPEFEEMFEVFSTNQIEARFILTTSFMERIKRLSELKVNSGDSRSTSASEQFAEIIANQGFSSYIKKIYGVRCSFVENKMYISINMSYNLFEASSINKTLLDIEDIHIFLAQMNSFFEIIKILKLNEKITLQA